MALEAEEAFNVFIDDEDALVYRKDEADREIRKERRRRFLVHADHALEKATDYKKIADMAERHGFRSADRYRRLEAHMTRRYMKCLEIANKFKEIV